MPPRPPLPAAAALAALKRASELPKPAPKPLGDKLKPPFRSFNPAATPHAHNGRSASKLQRSPLATADTTRRRTEARLKPKDEDAVMDGLRDSKERETFAKLNEIKTTVFNLQSPIRPFQLDAIRAAVEDLDLLLIAGTGSGKSLAFLAPAAFSPPAEGTTVIISPLVALIQDQVNYCQSLKSPDMVAMALSGQVPYSLQLEALDKLRAGKLNVLFATPEQLILNTALAGALELRPPKRIVFDEAHCIINWGASFRPMYMEACEKVKRSFPKARWTMVTATAPPNVRSSLVALFPRAPQVFAASSTVRPNLTYEIRPKSKAKVVERIAELCGKETSLVYVMTKADADEVLAGLLGAGIRAVGYHSGMTQSAKKTAQEQWLAGEATLLVATPAFGMGVHHPSVRFVVHHSLPLSLSEYAQASGRAGRDGLPARCVIYFSKGDYGRAKALIQRTSSDTGDLSEVYSVCALEQCMRLAIAQHMGELEGKSCGIETCSICASAALHQKSSAAERKAFLKRAEVFASRVAAAAAAPSVASPLGATNDAKKPSQVVVDDVQNMDEVVQDIDSSAAADAMTTTQRSSKLRTQLLALAKRRGLDAKEVPSKAAIARALGQGSLTVHELEAIAGWGPRRAELWSEVIAKY